MVETITLDQREFSIMRRLQVNGINYIYAIASDESGDFTVLKEDGEYVESVTDENVVRFILKSIAEEVI